LHCLLPKQDFAQALVRVTEALKTGGFGILTHIDVQATMNAKRNRLERVRAALA
jgi:uncharacterized protein (DUF302 family)